MAGYISFTQPSINSGNPVYIYGGTSVKYAWKSLTNSTPIPGKWDLVETDTGGFEDPLITVDGFIDVEQLLSANATFTITAIDGDATTISVTTSAPHGLTVGDRVVIWETTNYNGSFIIATKATSTFTITSANHNFNSESSGKVVEDGSKEATNTTYMSQDYLRSFAKIQFDGTSAGNTGAIKFIFKPADDVEYYLKDSTNTYDYLWVVIKDFQISIDSNVLDARRWNFKLTLVETKVDE